MVRFYSGSFSVKWAIWAAWIICGTVSGSLFPSISHADPLLLSQTSPGVSEERTGPSAWAEKGDPIFRGNQETGKAPFGSVEENLSGPSSSPERPTELEGASPFPKILSPTSPDQWTHPLAEQKDRLQQTAQRYPSSLQPLVEASLRWLHRAEQLVQKWQQTASELAQNASQRETLQQQFHRTQQKVEAVGQTQSIGLLLRKQRAALPDPYQIQSQIRSRQPEIQTITLDLFDCQDRRTEMANLEAEIQRRQGQLGPPPPTISPEAWQQAIRELLLLELEQMDLFIQILHRYFETLVELDQEQTKLVRLVEEYQNYVDERILWIRSTPLWEREMLRHGMAAVHWFVQWEHGRQLAQASFQAVQAYPVQAAGVLLLLLVWGYAGTKLRSRISQIAQEAQQQDYCRFLPTLQTVWMTAAAAGFWPAVFWLVPWCLAWPINPQEWVRSVGAALQLTAWVLLPGEVLLVTCQVHGLADSHFGWPISSMKALRRWLRTCLAATLPWVFLAAVFYFQSDQRFDSSLGRGAFILLMAVWTAGWALLLRAKGELVRGVQAQGQRPWWLRFRFLVYWLGVLTPVGLALLAAGGYYYTAQQLAIRFYASVAALVAVAWVGAILRRGILILQRRTAKIQAEAAHSLSEPSPSPPEPTPPTGPEKSSALPDLGQIGLQVERLLSVMLFLGGIGAVSMIWMDILPALGMLKRIPLWQIAWEGAGAAASEGPSAGPAPGGRWVTAADLMWSVVVLLFTYLAAKNLPALLELLLPQKFPLDQGARYALKTLVQYVVVLVGLLVGLPPLGVTWTRMQWLVAALGVGLGFGLQEIFANFVSGLILLFERPIRIGDIITIGDITGVVSKIHIRATIITNWDRQDLIVPNKEFITSRVLNWTLTNQTNRIVLQVGVAYGSDPDRVRRMLEEILQEHPLVLRDPAPLVTLENLGDNALQFTIRAYLPTLDKRLQTIHELYTAIHNRLRREGIEIPFPQREVHIRSWSSPGQGASS